MTLALNMLFLAILSDTVYVVAFFVLAGLWAFEHFIIQASLFECPPITRYPLCYQLGRLSLNVLVAVFVISMVAVPWIWVFIGLDFILSLVVIAYQKYFHKPFKPFSAIKNLREGLKVSSFAVRIISPKTWLLMGACLAVKLCLAIFISQRGVDQSESTMLWIAIVSLALISVIVLLLQKSSFRFSSIRHASMMRMVYAYGYSMSWLADYFLSPNAEDVAEEAAELQKSYPNRISSDVMRYEIDSHLVILQLESLDWNILNFSLDGKPVTPFLNELASGSQHFKVVAYHDQGSADMDYAVLSGGIPSKRMLSYSMPGLTYSESLPRFMTQQGFKTRSFHGATGNFFNRRTCFDQMGWDEICFREELDGDGVESSYWGVRDKDVFRISAEKLQRATGREFHFIITLDSHGPFNLIKDEEKTIFPRSRDWQKNYFNSMAALDNNLRDYVNALPPETLVVLYGDHTSGVNYGDFSPARDETTEFVPCIVHKRTSGDTEKPNPIDATTLPADLSILDIIHCMRQKMES